MTLEEALAEANEWRVKWATAADKMEDRAEKAESTLHALRSGGDDAREEADLAIIAKCQQFAETTAYGSGMMRELLHIALRRLEAIHRLRSGGQQIVEQFRKKGNQPAQSPLVNAVLGAYLNCADELEAFLRVPDPEKTS